MTDAPRVLVVDDGPVSRQAACQVLARDSRVRIVGVAENPARAFDYALSRHPAVIVTDIRMREVGGPLMAEALGQRVPTARLVVATASEKREDVLAALGAGACGYVLKPYCRDELVPAILAAARGESWLSPRVARTLVDEVVQMLSAQATQPFCPVASLTPRELSVLSLLSRGMTNREIAAALRIAETTVKTHVGNVMVKLKVRNRLEAATVALRIGVVRDSIETGVRIPSAA